jgi:hypothetical protein
MGRPALRRALGRALALALVLTPLPAHAAGLCTSRATTENGVTADPVGTTGCPGVRPGAELNSGTELCSFGFLFTGSDRRRYVSTAGHCAFATDPTTDTVKVWKPGTGPVAKDAGGKQVGRFVYATMAGLKDFALVRLDPNVAASPQLCHFGGPTSLTTEVHNRDVLVHHYGQGVGLDYLPARTGEAFFGLYRDDYVYFYGASSEGDSGSPVIDDSGAAVGLITDLTTPFTGNVGVNRLAGHLAAAGKSLKIRLTLATAPTL